jgi:DNA-binding transcriptional LysR family regulator
MLFDIDDLLLFAQIARTGNITAAATTVGLLANVM